ncbi:MAG: hypothetical protein PHS92_02015 [Candidatus Gracilibacteria bacterium]|nr:hypothetical protein [Candidatus Gracilibacteria bacterium]
MVIKPQDISGIQEKSKDTGNTSNIRSHITDSTRSTFRRYAMIMGLVSAIGAPDPTMIQAATISSDPESGFTTVELKRNLELYGLKKTDFGKKMKLVAGPTIISEDTNDMFELFRKFKIPKYIDMYDNLFPDTKKKLVMDYFTEGSRSQQDKKALIKGTLNFIKLQDGIGKSMRFIEYYRKNGDILRNTDNDALLPYARMALSAFSGADKFIDLNKYSEIDSIILRIYDSVIARSKENIARSEENIAKNNEDIRLLEVLLMAVGN